MSIIAGTAITNLRNRIEASKKSATYSERTHVDAPVHELEAMLGNMSKLRHALENVTKDLQTIIGAPYCVSMNLAAFQRQVDGAKATLEATE
jgi:hypothetical protein